MAHIELRHISQFDYFFEGKLAHCIFEYDRFEIRY